MLKQLMNLVEKRDRLASAIDAGYVDTRHMSEVNQLSAQINRLLSNKYHES